MLFMASFVVILVGMALMIAGLQGSVGGSAVILVGPIPIIGSFGKNFEPVTFLALGVTLLALLLILLSWRTR